MYKIIGLLFIVVVSIYAFSLNTRLANIEKRLGGEKKLACAEDKLLESVSPSIYRIVGSYSEGTGFAFYDNLIVTNFHVIESEVSPKIIFPDGSIETPTNILGNKQKDIAFLKVNKEITPLKFYGALGTLDAPIDLEFGENLYALGYAMGSNIEGDVSVTKGSYFNKRYLKDFDMDFVQTDLTASKGMSGGPLVNVCGQVVGINTLGIAGLSMFLDINSVQVSASDVTKDDIVTSEPDLTNAKGVVEAFYSFIKSRNLQLAYDLISKERTKEVNFEEWVKGYKNTIQVDVISIKEQDDKQIFVKISSSDWTNGDLITKYFEGTWEVITEGKDLKLNKSNIKEVIDPGFDWFYSH